MKIWIISDTHCNHKDLIIPSGIDMIIHSGDATNSKALHKNIPEAEDFLQWYGELDVEYKILVPGNHDLAMFHKKVQIPKNIIYLEHKEITINKFKIFGSPYTPTFGQGWAWNKGRGNLSEIWEDIPNDTNILITHGPAKYILDLNIEDGLLCGCTALYKRVKELKELKLHTFGHIHHYGGHQLKSFISDALFVNAAVVNDRLSITNHGLVIDL